MLFSTMYYWTGSLWKSEVTSTPKIGVNIPSMRMVRDANILDTHGAVSSLWDVEWRGAESVNPTGPLEAVKTLGHIERCNVLTSLSLPVPSSVPRSPSKYLHLCRRRHIVSLVGKIESCLIISTWDVVVCCCCCCCRAYSRSVSYVKCLPRYRGTTST